MTIGSSVHSIHSFRRTVHFATPQVEPRAPSSATPVRESRSTRTSGPANPPSRHEPLLRTHRGPKTPIAERERYGTLYPRGSTATALCATDKLIAGDAPQQVPSNRSASELKLAARNLVGAWHPDTEGNLITKGSNPDHRGFKKHYVVHYSPFGGLLIEARHRPGSQLLVSSNGNMWLQGVAVNEASSPKTLRRVTARLNAAWDALAAWPAQGAAPGTSQGASSASSPRMALEPPAGT